MKQSKTILITGAAGFIGSSLILRLLQKGYRVIGLDNLNSYYSKSLKVDRLNLIENESLRLNAHWIFYKCSLEDSKKVDEIFLLHKPEIVVNLGAQAGVRYSLQNPSFYIQSNLVGFFNIIENCKNYNVVNFIYASSSSVYGANKSIPFKEKDSVDHPVSLYAATKKSNEIIAHTYSHLYNLSCTGLRLFTVYGPWGRPDMAPILFADAITKGEPLKIFNYGKMSRDFTYIDDIVRAFELCILKPAKSNLKFNHSEPDPSSSSCPHLIFNLGNNKPVKLMRFIELLEENFGIKAKKEFVPIQKGDVEETYADNKKLDDWIKFKPNTSIEVGIRNFVNWYKSYYLK